MYSIVQRVYPLTVDSLLSPGTSLIAFVILINYYELKISNENPTSEVASVPDITMLELTTIVCELNQSIVLKSSVESSNFSLPRFNP